MSTPDTPFAALADVSFVKGHGTQNDFVLLFDDDSRLEMHPETIATLSDRRAGLGADGIIRIVRSAASGIPEPMNRPRPEPNGSWTTTTTTAACPRCAATESVSSPTRS